MPPRSIERRAYRFALFPSCRGPARRATSKAVAQPGKCGRRVSMVSVTSRQNRRDSSKPATRYRNLSGEIDYEFPDALHRTTAQQEQCSARSKARIYEVGEGDSKGPVPGDAQFG